MADAGAKDTRRRRRRGRGGRGAGGEGHGDEIGEGRDSNECGAGGFGEGKAKGRGGGGRCNRGGGGGGGKRKEGGHHSEKKRGGQNATAPAEPDAQSSRGGREQSRANAAGTAKQRPSDDGSKKVDDFIAIGDTLFPRRTAMWRDGDIGSGASQTTKAITVLHVAEKPSIAQAVAKALGGHESVMVAAGATPVHEIVGLQFPMAPRARSCRHRVTSVTGHIYGTDFPSSYQNWKSTDPAELFAAPIVKKATRTSTVRHLERESKIADFIVLWMDCDREGENINFEVIGIFSRAHSRAHSTGGAPTMDVYNRTFRAHFSAIAESDILAAYRNLGKPDACSSLSVDARQELDLKVGVAFSRFQTQYFQGRYGDLDSSVISYGPCQTPTLGFVVRRHIEIETFRPEPYWMLSLALSKQGFNCRCSWEHGRVFSKKKIQKLIDMVVSAGNPVARVSDINTRDVRQGRPTGLNTVGLLKAASKVLHMGPHHAMQVAERLYLQGLISYPRTESSAYPSSFDFEGTLRAQCGDESWGGYARRLLASSYNRGRGGRDMGDHPPITPCRAPLAGELSGDSARLYEFIVRQFLASISDDAVWTRTRLNIEIPVLGGEHGKFFIAGKKLKEPGFLSVLSHSDEDDEGGDGQNEEDPSLMKGEDDEDEVERLPSVVVGETLRIFAEGSQCDGASGGKCFVSSLEKMTTPPEHLTESELISKMERNGIGTDASIPTHIQNIQNRNYAELVTGRQLRPTRLGVVLGNGYLAIDPSLVLPDVRARIESECAQIARGEADLHVVVEDALRFFFAKFRYFEKNIDKMDLLFETCFAKLKDAGRPFIRCGLTRKYLSLIEGPPARLYNRWTETIYTLPAGGNVKLWSGRTCDVCSFELLLYTVGNPAKTFPCCVACFNAQQAAVEEEARRQQAEKEVCGPGDSSFKRHAAGVTVEVVDDEDGQDDPEGMRTALDGLSMSSRRVERDGGEKGGGPMVAGQRLTLDCPLPDDHPNVREFAVCKDPEEPEGIFILDCAPSTSKWRLVSTRTPTIVSFPPQVARVAIVPNKWDDFVDSGYIEIEFKKPLEDGSMTYSGCFLKDAFIQKLVRVHTGDARLAPEPSMRGRGRGRGRRGRSRGRGGHAATHERFDSKMSFGGF